jgi:hypothetical protein
MVLLTFSMLMSFADQLFEEYKIRATLTVVLNQIAQKKDLLLAWLQKMELDYLFVCQIPHVRIIFNPLVNVLSRG